MSVVETLVHGELEIAGRLVDASNATLQCEAVLDGFSVTCVYKPQRGERPLWDFPSGTLGVREVAAYEVSSQLGWGVIPTTVWREAGPYGPGMCQAWIDVEDDQAPVIVAGRSEIPPAWHVVAEGDGYGGEPVVLAHEDSEALMKMTVLDTLLNNADRKGGHVLRAADGRVYGIDHGLTFHEESKLRTVLWGWAGKAIPDSLGEPVERLVVDGVKGEAWSCLSRAERSAFMRRGQHLLATGQFPLANSGWPALPWPAM